MDLAIEIKDLNHSFGKKIICNNMNINFEYGKIYGLLGRNGTGKSTLINLIGNQLVCKDGEIKIFGKTVKEDISVLEDICIVREKEFFLKDYKVKSIFNMHSKFYKNYDYNLQKKLCRLFEINEKLTYKSLSRGQKTLLSNISFRKSRLTFFTWYIIIQKSIYVKSLIYISEIHFWYIQKRYFVCT